jgi:hypothetical protein
MSLYTDANGTHVDGAVKDSGSNTLVASARGASVAAVATADGSDAATTQALANALKVKLNALIAVLATGKFPS